MIKYGRKYNSVVHMQSPYVKHGILCKVVKDFDANLFNITKFRLEVTCKKCLRCIDRGDIERCLEERYL